MGPEGGYLVVPNQVKLARIKHAIRKHASLLRHGIKVLYRRRRQPQRKRRKIDVGTRFQGVVEFGDNLRLKIF